MPNGPAESQTTMNGEKESHFAPFRYHERILNNRSGNTQLKVKALIGIWRNLRKLDTNTDRGFAAEILNWAKLHSLNIVLSAEWNNLKGTYKEPFIKEIEITEKTIAQYGKGFQAAARRLIEVVNSPWDNPILQNIINWTHEHSVCWKQIDFFYMETAYLVSIRLKILCESQCEDLALNLATVFLDCCVLTKDNFNGTNDQKWYIFDVFIALLYKFHDNNRIVNELKKLSFDEGLQFSKRFSEKRICYLKLWENSREIAIVALQIYISQIMIKYDNSLRTTLSNFVRLYKSICSTKILLRNFSDSMDRISNLTDSAGLEELCDILRANYDTALKPLLLKTYVKLLTAEMNVREELRDTEEITKIDETQAKLARILTSLAECFDDHVNVARECLLTAFSLCPTKERLAEIENFARRSGFELVDIEKQSKCSHPTLHPSGKVTSQCCCGEWVNKSELEWPKVNIPLYEAMQSSVLGISKTLCDDLVVCLSSPRNKIFSWLLPWNDLHKLCLMHLKNPQATQNVVKELDFINIDYSVFKDMKREPIDYFEGIENGYEHYIYPDLGIKFPKYHASSNKRKSRETTDGEKKMRYLIMASSARVVIERLDYKVDSKL